MKIPNTGDKIIVKTIDGQKITSVVVDWGEKYIHLYDPVNNSPETIIKKKYIISYTFPEPELKAEEGPMKYKTGTNIVEHTQNIISAQKDHVANVKNTVRSFLRNPTVKETSESYAMPSFKKRSP